jgi:hypothetical protein
MVVGRPKEGFKKDQRRIKERPDNSCRNNSQTCAVVDLHGALRKINSTALEVACPPPEHGRKNQENYRDHHSSTYVASGVGVED